MYDTNKDGSIDFKEYMIIVYTMMNGSPEERLKLMFQIFDVNNDGSVSYEEIYVIGEEIFIIIIHYHKTQIQVIIDLFSIPVRYLFLHKNQGETTQEKLEDEAKEKIEEISRDILKEMDVNSDGNISKDEFMKYVHFLCYFIFHSV